LASKKKVATRAARWFTFKPKILVWVIFVGSCNGRYWYIVYLFGLFYRPFGNFGVHLLYFLIIWCNFPVLVCCTEQNLATLVATLTFFVAETFFNGVEPILRPRINKRSKIF
jgi:hypothetical protein